jgi:hypothetical protein
LEVIKVQINKNIHLIIALVGLVFFLLTLTSQGEDSALTTAFLFILLLIGSKLVEEFFYYRKYSAPLASGIFLVLPSLLALAASFVARISTLNGRPFLQNELIKINLDFSFIFLERIIIFENSFSSVFVAPFYFILSILLYRYYKGIYPRLFLFRRKFFKQFAMYYNLGLIILVGTIWSYHGNILLIELIFVILSIVFIIQTYILKIILVPVRIRPRHQSTQSSGRSRPGITRAYARTSPTGSTISTNNPSGSSLRSRSQQSTIQNSESNTRSDHGNNNIRNNRSVQVLEARQLQRKTSKKESNRNKRSIQEYIPRSQHLTRDDFKCIFCYEIPNSNENVVICPNCRKPAHYNEYRQWSSYSKICSYCNKDIGTSSPKSMTGKNYSKIISLALKGG